MSELDELVNMRWWQAHHGPNPKDMDYIGILGSVDIRKAAAELAQLHTELKEARRVIENVVIMGRFKDHEIALSAISNIFNMAEKFIVDYPDHDDRK